jgi:hypothetical protein
MAAVRELAEASRLREVVVVNNEFGGGIGRPRPSAAAFAIYRGGRIRFWRLKRGQLSSWLWDCQLLLKRADC